MSFQTALKKAFITIFTRKTWQKRKIQEKGREAEWGKVPFISIFAGV